MKISLCIICKNEEEKIARCIQSVKECVNEIVVVDTGSKDKTIEIAKSLGAKVYEIPWENDFSQARNYAINKAKGNWIVFLDADEYLVETCKNQVRKCILDAINIKKDYIMCKMINLRQENEMMDSFSTIRIFKKAPEIKYKGKIHEILYKEQGELYGYDCSENIVFLHDGYIDKVVQEKNKVERNLEALLEEYKKDPSNSNTCFYLMQIYKSKKDTKSIWQYGCKMLECGNSDLLGAEALTYTMLLEVCGIEKKDKKIVEELYQRAIQCDDIYPDIDYRYGIYWWCINEYNKAAIYISKSIEKAEKYRGYVSSYILANGLNVLKVLASCYLKQNRNQDAIPVLIKILRVSPYEFAELLYLIQILSQEESAENIGTFLLKMYDPNKPMNQKVLLEITKKSNQEELYNYILNNVNKVI